MNNSSSPRPRPRPPANPDCLLSTPVLELLFLAAVLGIFWLFWMALKSPTRHNGDMAAPAHPTGGVLIGGTGSAGQGMSPVTPSDTQNVVSQGYARSLYIVDAGNIHCTGLDGNEFTIAVPANFVLPVCVVKVWAAATSSTQIYAIW
jgi:hypothetical protein